LKPSHNEQIEWDRISIGLNRENFIRDILEKKFNASFRLCAEAMGLKPNYLRDIVMNPDRGAGTKMLSCIYRYCMKNGLDPELYIFVKS